MPRSGMDPDLVIKVIGVAASAAVPILVHLLTHPRRRVSYLVEQKPVDVSALPKSASQSDSLSLVTVSLWASGRTDISSTAFDAQKPIVFQFSAPIVDAVTAPDPSHIPGWGFERVDTNQVVVHPSLLGRGTVFSTTVAVPTPVRYWMRHPLADVPVVLESALPGTKSKTSKRGSFRLNGMIVGLVLVVLGFILPFFGIGAVDNLEVIGVLTVLSGLLTFAGLITVLVSAIVRIVQWSARRRSQTTNAAAQRIGDDHSGV